MQPIAERLTPAIKALMIVHTVAFLFFAIVHEAQPFIIGHLMVGPGFWREPWQPLTSMFVDAYGGGGGAGFFLLDLLGLWFVGAYVERAMGLRRFVTWYFLTGVLATTAAGLLSTVVGVRGIYGGLNISVIGLFVAFARINGPSPTPVLGGLVMKAHHLALVVVALAVVGDLSQRDLAGLGSTVVIALAGYALAGRGGLRELYEGMRAQRARQRYRVLEGGATRKPKPRSNDKYWN
jgi:membrane associated rhomboid family serine protease